VAAANKASAGAAGLRYVTDDRPGITRRRRGKGFQYIAPGGGRVAQKQIERIKRLAIPPAWTDVWICPDPNGHLQATGRDARKRKQYRYHPDWRATRDKTKYDRMVAFGEALPKIRRRVSRDLRRRKLDQRRVVAAVVHLLDTTNIRVGNEHYARENNSFGLTTMRDRHVDVHGSKVEFSFRGKGGKWQQVELSDPRVARVVRRCEGLPGQQLFQYLDEEGDVVDVNSEDVNDYLREITGDEFTAKDFRTWSGTVVAAWALEELGEHTSDREARRQIVDAVKSVAEELGNTPAVARRSYVHPYVFESHLGGKLQTLLNKESKRKNHAGLTGHEAAVLALLRRLDAA
jgi:DNA topoisomerase-1